MNDLGFLEPEEIEIELAGGGTKTFIISKFPAVSGREIISQYPISGIPKLGDYKTNEEIMMKIMSFVAVKTSAGPAIKLTTRELVNNHVPSWEDLARIEWAMMEFNTSFLADGRASSFFDDLGAKLPSLISSMLTPLLEQLSQKNTPLSKS